MTNEEKTKLETELWQLEVVLDNPEFLLPIELIEHINRLEKLKGLLGL